MPNQPENKESEAARSTLYQGAYPPPNPVQGDVWIDPFDTSHVWQGYYWVKVQGPTMVPEQEPNFVAHYDGYRVYYGYPRPEHAEATYWVSDGKAISDAEIFESVTAKMDPAGLGNFKKSHWQHVTDPYITEDIKNLLSLSFVEKGPVSPEVSLAQERCSEEEANEKLKAFEEAADLTGRLDMLKQKEESKKNRMNQLLTEWLTKEPDYKVIPPRDPGLIQQINQVAAYENLTPAALEEFIKTLYHKP